jgi:surface antigen
MIMKLLLLVLLIATGPAWALNMSGFKDAPITRLSSEELKVFRAFVMKTLDQTPDGTTVEWKAEKTRFVSRLTPQKSFTNGQRPCREITIESDAHDRYLRGLYTLCKGANGEWQFTTPGVRQKAK